MTTQEDNKGEATQNLRPRGNTVSVRVLVVRLWNRLPESVLNPLLKHIQKHTEQILESTENVIIHLHYNIPQHSKTSLSRSGTKVQNKIKSLMKRTNRN